MARLPWLIKIRFWVPRKFLFAQENEYYEYFEEILLFCHVSTH